MRGATGPVPDPLQTLRPIGDEAQPYFRGKPMPIIDPIAEKYALQGNIAVSYTHLTLPTKRIV